MAYYAPYDFDTHPKAMINRAKFHFCMFSGFGEVIANASTNAQIELLLYTIDLKSFVACIAVILQNQITTFETS